MGNNSRGLMKFMGVVASLIAIVVGLVPYDEGLTTVLLSESASYLNLPVWLTPLAASVIASTSQRSWLPEWMQPFLDGLAFNVGVASNGRDPDFRDIEVGIGYTNRF